MNIGEAAKKTGLSAKMIRHYESQGLFRPAGRTAAGYRHYNQEDIEILEFIGRARALDFSLPQIAELLELRSNPKRASRDVKHTAEQHLSTVRFKIRQLKAMQKTLETMIAQCPGDDTPDCTILSALETR
ncbi:Cu(I)-responsive transcriptional regulator [Lacimicrobium sp. SS2-24]|uniref:Cu(I)-responsive transcriptional regulator n=1 Tax=Lacimicrobium sp. SS2-24 TaxID=2005569 RepID=UPI000B4A5F71|nr:Cu(I)-responsive transcriptional regulator [Lacimicrobium sp. SS2-24]